MAPKIVMRMCFAFQPCLPGAGCKTRLESRKKNDGPRFIYDWGSGLSGDDAIAQDAHSRFMRYVDGDTEAIHPDLREVVFKIVMRKGGRHEYDALIALYTAADAADQRVTILKALGATADRGVMDLVMEFTMSTAVRDQDVYAKSHYYNIASLFQNGAVLANVRCVHVLGANASRIQNTLLTGFCFSLICQVLSHRVPGCQHCGAAIHVGMVSGSVLCFVIMPCPAARQQLAVKEARPSCGCCLWPDGRHRRKSQPLPRAEAPSLNTHCVSHGLSHGTLAGKF